MTYRQKLLLRRLLIIFGILIAAAALILILGFYYLGRYVVYTEDGAYFSFQKQDTASSVLEPEAPGAAPENPVLVTGASIREDFALVEELEIPLEDYEINGLIVDYETLKDGSTLNQIDFSEESYNTLVLELRAQGSELLQTPAVETLMRRAQSQDIKLIAMISCLDDREYALAHQNQALPIEGGALWVSSSGSYWLDPSEPDVQNYIEDLILQLCDRGFAEVILENFYFPESDYIDYDTGEKTRADLGAEAYQALADRLEGRCILGLYIPEPDNGHQAYDLAEHLFVYMGSGNSVAEYDQSHSDRYIVYITDSHDTRFDSYGKLQAERDAGFIPETDETE